jgi:hypothetical protein
MEVSLPGQRVGQRMDWGMGTRGITSIRMNLWALCSGRQLEGVLHGKAKKGANIYGD